MARVLVIDDDEDTCDLFSTILRNAGHVVQVALERGKRASPQRVAKRRFESHSMLRLVEIANQTRGAGVALALPWLDAMRPALAAESKSAAAAADATPRRMIAICNNLAS